MMNRILNGIIRVIVYQLIVRHIYKFFRKGFSLVSLIVIGMLVSFFLSGCGGSGSGGANSPVDTTQPSNPNQPTNPISSPSYAGFNTQYGTTITDLTVFQSGELYKVDNHLAFVITDPDARYMDALVYQPECVLGSIEYDYDSILIYGATTAPSRVRISARATNPVVTTLVERQAGGFVDYSTETLTGTCDEGMFYDSTADATYFQNGNSIVYKDMDGNIYFGFRNQLVDKSLLLSKVYKRYDHAYAGAVTKANTMATYGSNGSNYALDSSASSSFTFNNPNTNIKGFVSSSPNEIYSIQGSYARLWDNQTSTLRMFGITKTIGGKNFSILNAVYSQCSTPVNHNGELVCEMTGAGLMSIYTEQ